TRRVGQQRRSKSATTIRRRTSLRHFHFPIWAQNGHLTGSRTLRMIRPIRAPTPLSTFVGAAPKRTRGLTRELKATCQTHKAWLFLFGHHQPLMRRDFLAAQRKFSQSVTDQ